MAGESRASRTARYNRKSLMYFDFEDYRPELHRIERAISWREGVLLSIIVHLLAVIGALTLPRFLPVAIKPANVVALAEPPPQNPRFVFVQPRVDLRAIRPPQRADNSDQDRMARARERARSGLRICTKPSGSGPSQAHRRAPDGASSGHSQMPKRTFHFAPISVT